MKRTVIAALAAALLIPASASAAGPKRTEKQATDRIGKTLASGAYQCYGRNGDGSDLYRSFNCLVDDWEADSSHVYRLHTRKHGRWRIREL